MISFLDSVTIFLKDLLDLLRETRGSPQKEVAIQRNSFRRCTISFFNHERQCNKNSIQCTFSVGLFTRVDTPSAVNTDTFTSRIFPGWVERIHRSQYHK